jgi:PKD repeat protein
MGAAVAGVLVFAPSASAATFCVQDPSCSGTAEPTLAAALSAADVAIGRDTIRVGPVLLPNGGVDVAGNPVDIEGAGSGVTTLGTALSVLEPSSVVTNLRVQLSSGGAALTLKGGTASGVIVGADAGVSATGVVMQDDATFKHGKVLMPTGTSGYGVISSGPGTKTIDDATITAYSFGILVQAPAATMNIVRHVRVTALQGIGTQVGAVSVDDAVVRTLAPMGLSDLPLGLWSNSFAGDSSITASHVTEIGPGTAGTSAGIFSYTSATHVSTVSASDSIFLDNGTDAEQLGIGGSLAVDYSRLTTRSGTVGGAHNVTDLPAFVSQSTGDFRLRFDSHLIDAGDPAPLGPSEPPFDLDGNVRIADGNGDGVARRDMGAFEYQRRAPVAAATASLAAAAVGQTVTFDGSGSHDPDPGDSLVFAWRFDDGATATGPIASHAFATAGTHSATLTVTDPTGLTGAATRTVIVTSSALRPPVVTVLSFSVAPRTFRVASAATPVSARRPPRGARLRYVLSAPADVRIVIVGRLPGRRSGGRCAKPTRRLRHAHACTRLQTMGTLTRAGRPAGVTSTPFSGRIGGRVLRPGAYQATIAAAAVGGPRSAPRTARFRIVAG